LAAIPGRAVVDDDDEEKEEKEEDGQEEKEEEEEVVAVVQIVSASVASGVVAVWRCWLSQLCEEDRVNKQQYQTSRRSLAHRRILW
jgi:hypothetical protein